MKVPRLRAMCEARGLKKNGVCVCVLGSVGDKQTDRDRQRDSEGGRERGRESKGEGVGEGEKAREREREKPYH